MDRPEAPPAHPQPQSASSAVDFSQTLPVPSGSAAALAASDGSSGHGHHARKRTSWGKVPAGADPLTQGFPDASVNLDRPPVLAHSASGASQASTQPFGDSTTNLLPDPSHDPALYGSQPLDPPFTFTSGRGRRFSTAQAGPSSMSLVSRDSEFLDVQTDDDEAGLTAHASRMAGRGWRVEDVQDSSAPAPDTPSAASTTRRRTTLRYTPSPRAKAGDRLKTMSQTVRRMSMRVVNLAGRGLEDHVRLEDTEDDNGKGKGRANVDVVEDDYGEKDVEEDDGRPPGAPLPIRGRTLGFLGPTNPVRLFLYRLLVNPWSESIILFLIIASTVIFVIQASHPLPAAYNQKPVFGYFHQWEDYAQFGLFVFFTIELFARISVTGLLLDPDIPITALFKSTPPTRPLTTTYPDSSLSRQSSLARTVSLTHTLARAKSRLLRPFALSHQPGGSPTFANGRPTTPTHIRAETAGVLPNTPMLEKGLRAEDRARRAAGGFSSSLLQPERNRFLELPFKLSVDRGREVMRRNMPYLRHSWNRLDFLAVASFWVAFVLATGGWEHAKAHIGVFRALSVLRAARLLALSAGTTTIMRSLKTAMPLLTNVAYFVLFAIGLFSIIGLETFQGSLRRSCHLEIGGEDIQLGQFCGGYIDPTTLNATGYITSKDQTHGRVKGYICPLPQTCKEGDNPQDNTQSFDTIAHSIMQVVIIAGANQWAPLMYNIIDAENFGTCFFFIVALLVLNFWLLNLFVAVITNTFSAIRGDTNKSAFGAAPLGPTIHEDENEPSASTRKNHIKMIYENTRLCWVFLALASLVLQATNSVDASDLHKEIIKQGELVLTIAFDVEILIRVATELPQWQNFFGRANNLLDLVLAVACSIIQIPVIRDSSVYSWLTAFQLVRFYRVILEVPRMRPLLLAVFGNLYGLWSMSVFLVLMNGLSALFAIQLLRPDLPADGTVTFLQFFNAFLGTYQVFSSENWTDVLYAAIKAELPLGQAIIVAIFVTIWFLFANFIILQMFIAVINENFDVAEEAKRSRQAEGFWAKQAPKSQAQAWKRRLNPYRWFAANPKSMTVESLPASLVLPMQKALVQDYQLPKRADAANASWEARKKYTARSMAALRRLFKGDQIEDAVPLATLRHARRPSGGFEDPLDEELERHMEMLAMVQTETTDGQDLNDLIEERRARKADFIREHPSYDKTFWIFSQKNPIRQFCQKLVEPANGERIFGVPPSPILSTVFQLILLLVVIAGIVVEGIATPTYRRKFYLKTGPVRGAWFDMAESAFTLTLVIEFIIKVIADGFLFTPNSYVRSIWNILDLLVLIGIVVNVTTSLIFIGGLSRITRSLKALRALRLVTLIEKMRSTFQDLILSGAVGIFDAATLAILYMIPYAVWGFNIFASLMNQCNDGDDSITGLANCNGEFVNKVVGDTGGYGFLAPRVWDNPSPSTTFSFDNFRSSLLILFEIVSLEGWIDVMGVATSITGKDQQPKTNASEANAIFFLIYHMMGGVVILTLFVSIIIGNFRAKTGTALLTQPQREWIDLQKLLRRQQPSERPKRRPTIPVRAWCYDRAEQKHGWWSRSMTLLLFIHIIVLSTQSFGMNKATEEFRKAFFLAFALIYAVDTIIRFYGLGWRSFNANRWNLFDVVISAGALFTTAASFVYDDVGHVMQQARKLFLVAAAFKLVQRVDSLNKLFKTAMSSLPVIISLLSLWFIFFLFFAIMFVEVFGLTKWGGAENHLQNYSTLGSALTMLAFMSTGEGWNQYMHDYALAYPRCTNTSIQDFDSDCGSEPFAFALFIAWNLLSMYIFVNMFTGVVVESFSYVFQATDGSKAITRGQMRAFKEVWGKHANPKSGYLERDKLVPFLYDLRGVFETRIYPVEHSVRSITDASRADDTSDLTDSSVVYDEKHHSVDLKKLHRVLDSIDHTSIRKRRNLYIRLYHEAVISCPPGRGLSFTEMLMLLAHYKLIVDREALVFKDLVVRSEVNRVVTDLVHLDRVRSLLRMVSLRRRYLREREIRLRPESLEIPDIIVDEGFSLDVPDTTRDITSPKLDSSAFLPDLDSPSRSPRQSMARASDSRMTLDVSRISMHSPMASPISPASRRSRRRSDMSMLSADMTDFTPRHSFAVDDDPNDIISSMQNSLWGEMMLEAAEENDD